MRLQDTQAGSFSQNSGGDPRHGPIRGVLLSLHSCPRALEATSDGLRPTLIRLTKRRSAVRSRLVASGARGRQLPETGATRVLMIIRESVQFGDKELYIETAAMAKQADGAVLVQYGAASSSSPPWQQVGARGDRFLPLTCDYMEHTGASAVNPGGYFSGKGARPDGDAHLAAHRPPTRPSFPRGRCETQIIRARSVGRSENPTDVHAMTGASCALHIGCAVGRAVRRLRVGASRAVRHQPDLSAV